MIEFIAELERGTGRVHQVLTVEHPIEGELFDDAYDYVPLADPVDWSAQPTPTSALRLIGGVLGWAETASLAAAQSQAIETIDSACEALRLAVISKMTQTEEYKLAEQHAREYRAAGYTGQAGRGVTGWTRAKHRDGWTDRDSADDILATADRWYSLLFDIRDARLAAKEDVRHETDVAVIGAIVDGVQACMKALALQINTTTTE